MTLLRLSHHYHHHVLMYHHNSRRNAVGLSRHLLAATQDSSAIRFLTSSSSAALTKDDDGPSPPSNASSTTTTTTTTTTKPDWRHAPEQTSQMQQRFSFQSNSNDKNPISEFLRRRNAAAAAAATATTSTSSPSFGNSFAPVGVHERMQSATATPTIPNPPTTTSGYTWQQPYSSGGLSFDKRNQSMQHDYQIRGVQGAPSFSRPNQSGNVNLPPLNPNVPRYPSNNINGMRNPVAPLIRPTNGPIPGPLSLDYSHHNAINRTPNIPPQLPPTDRTEVGSNWSSIKISEPFRRHPPPIQQQQQQQQQNRNINQWQPQQQQQQQHQVTSSPSLLSRSPTQNVSQTAAAPPPPPTTTAETNPSFQRSSSFGGQQNSSNTFSLSFDKSSPQPNTKILFLNRSQSSWQPLSKNNIRADNVVVTNHLALPSSWPKDNIAHSMPPKLGDNMSAEARLKLKANATQEAAKMIPQLQKDDIAALQNALRNALENNKRQLNEREEHFKRLKQQQQQQQAEFRPKSDMDTRPSWRVDEEYDRAFKEQNWKRREMQEAEQAKLRQEERERREALRRDRQKSKDLPQGSAVPLPDRNMDLNEVSQLFSVKMDHLKKIVKWLDPDAKFDTSSSTSFVLDVDMMELVAMELGFQPKRPPRRGRVTTENDRETLLQRRAFSEAAGTAEQYQSFPSRPPVVCIMGHVDHGKTTLMDSLRRRSRQAMAAAAAAGDKNPNNFNKKDSVNKADVAGTEAGGITQAISAFQIKLENNQQTAVTFLDTPGHAAFRAMRESGSQAADVIVLVVAADDGVSKQTIEIINFYKSLVKEVGPSGISLVVAMNKIDKDGIDVEESRRRIMNQLLEHDIVTEDVGVAAETNEYGPPVQLVPVSGLTGLGLEDLIESLALQSEVMDLRADVDARAEGLVMEASLDSGVGITADCVVRWGSLKRGDIVVSGTNWGKVKILKDVNDSTLDKALPSQPIQIVGFSSLPKAGDPFICVASEEIAKKLTERRKTMLAAKQQEMTEAAAAANAPPPPPVARSTPKRSHDDDDDDYDDDDDESPETPIKKRRKPHQQQQSQVEVEVNDNSIRVPMVVKADTDAALAAVRECLSGMADESAHPLVLDWLISGVGPVTPADVRAARQAGASILTFGLGKHKNDVRKIMDTEGVDARDHSIIYELMSDAKEVIAKHLPPVMEDVVHGKGRVQATFNVNGDHVAGLKILDGKLFKDKVTLHGKSLPVHYRVLRRGQVITPTDATIPAASLKIVKDDVAEVKKGDECGLVLEDFDDTQVDDDIECYSTRTVHRFS